VVVDDIDMAITHVIRGDDHVNNTPRQINIMLALGATPPIYAHTPTVLGPDGQKLSKRHGARSVLEYRDEGYLPEAMINMLARLGWSHGDEEVFTREQLVEWFDVPAISASASRFDPEKFAWINAEHIKRADIQRLAADVQSRLLADGVLAAPLIGQDWGRLMDAVALYRSRVQTLVQLAQEVSLFWRHPQVSDALRAQHLVPALGPALRDFCSRLAQCDWQAAAIAAEMKAVLAAHGLKMPQLAIPVRVAITGQTQTPSVDAVLWLMGRDAVLARLEAELQRLGV
jgi:glutamyl-tRNA synthetase